MNKDNAHLFLPLVQALVEGKQLQWSNGHGVWIDSNEPKFLEHSRYRIKPEPGEWWIVEVNNPYNQGAPYRYVYTENAAAQRFATDVRGEVIHVREVL